MQQPKAAETFSLHKSKIRYLKSLVKNKTALLGIIILIPIIVGSVFAGWLAPYDPTDQNIMGRLAAPGQQRGDFEYLLGSDALGRDVLSRIMYGGRVSMLVALVTVTISGIIGVSLGLAAGYFRGRLDAILMRIADIQLAIPSLVLALTIMAIFRPSLWNVILVLGITGWVGYARVIRSEVLSLREKEFVTAAKALGMGNFFIIFRHVLPNVTASIIVMSSVNIGSVILMEAALSFLGLGVQPPVPTWGNMIAEGRNSLYNGWWISTFPGLALSLTVIGINLIGDWLRDVLDPYLQLEGTNSKNK